MGSLEIAAPWNTVHGRFDRLISWRHWGETGTCGEHHSSPEEAIHISLGPWRARTEPLEMTQRQWTDSSRASLYNCKSPNIPYYHNNLRWGWRCGPKKVLPTISTLWCWDWGRTPGSVLEVIASLAESIHPVCLSVAQLAPRPASRSLPWAQHESSPPTAPHTGASEGAEAACTTGGSVRRANPPNLMNGEGDRELPVSFPSNRSRLANPTSAATTLFRRQLDQHLCGMLVKDPL